MATARIKEETRRDLAVQRQNDRQSILMARRNLLLDNSSSSSNDQSPIISNDEFRLLLQTLRKPNTRECSDALRRLNAAFFDSTTPIAQNRWINAFFVNDSGNAIDERIVHDLVGVFTNQNLRDSRCQAEAGVCLANLCCTNDQRYRSILARLVGPYFVITLIDGVETTRISLALASLHGLGNLAAESGDTNKKVIGLLIAQHAVESIGAIVGHNNVRIREAALIAFESIIATLRDGFRDALIVAMGNLTTSSGGRFFTTLIDIQGECASKEPTIENKSIMESCARLLLRLSDASIMPAPDRDQLRIILTTIQKATNDWNLIVVTCGWRMLGLFCGHDGIDGGQFGSIEFDLDTLELFFDIATMFATCPHVHLRQETSWVLARFFANRRLIDSIPMATASIDVRLARLFLAAVDAGTESLSKDVKRLTLSILDIAIDRRYIEKYDALSHVRSFLYSLAMIRIRPGEDADVDNILCKLDGMIGR